MRRTLLWAVSCVLLAALTACSDSSGPAADTGPNPDMMGDSGDAATSDSTTLTPYSITVVLADDFPPATPSTTPAVGATVAFDLPGGQREEVTTDATGAASVMVDFSQGPLTYTVYMTGCAAFSAIGVTQPPPQPIRLAKYPVEPGVTITGAINNPEANANGFLVSSPQARNIAETLVATYSLTVPANTPLSLVLFEVQVGQTGRNLTSSVLRWSRHEFAGFAADDTANIDAATGTLTPVPFTAEIILPTNQQNPFATDSFAFANVITSRSVVLGATSTSTLSTDSSKFDVSAEYVNLTDVGDTYTQYFLQLQNGARSVVRTPGLPGASNIGTDFLEPFQITAPANPAVIVPLHDAIEWNTPDATARGGLNVVRDGNIVWSVLTGPGVKRIDIPQLPSTADRNALLGTQTLNGALFSCADIDVLGCGRVTLSAQFQFAP